MRAIYGTEPDFANYNLDNYRTENIKKFWNNELGGGSIALDLKTSTVEAIATPIA